MQLALPENFSEVSIRVPWGHISGRWYGNQLERPILALHGWMDNCGTFARLTPLISPYHSILCVDLPGHGHSSHLPVGILYHITDFVHVILRIMKIYKWETVSLMGHSMGGSICFYFTSLYPERVDMVISLDIIKNVYSDPHTIGIPIMRYCIEKSLIDNDRLQMENHPEPPSYTMAECENLLHKGSNESVKLKNCKYILDRNIQKSELYPNKYYFSRDSRLKVLMDMNPNLGLSLEMAKRICDKSIPYLVIKGGKTRNILSKSTELDEYMVRYNRNFESHLYPIGTHHLHLNNPKSVAKIIINFLHRYEKRNLNIEKSKL